MKTLIATTEDYIKIEKTQLTAAATAGTNVTLTVGNNNGMAQYGYVVIGTPGTDTCEIQQINTAVTVGTSIQVATLLFNHGQDELVTLYRYNKRKFYGATLPSGSFTELTSYGSPKVIQVNNPQGTPLEYTGMEGYTYFKSTYFNSQTSEESDINDAIAVLADESTRYCSLYAIAMQAGLQSNPFITDGILETYRKRAENEVNSYIYSRYELPLLNQTTNAVEVPFIIENCTALLAAGYMDYREYGKDGEGVKWLGEARAVLKAVQNGTQRLIGTDMLEYQQKPLTQGISSFPNTVDPCQGEGQLFTMQDIF